MAEDMSFVAPGHLPSRWGYPGPPPAPQGYHPSPQGQQWGPQGYNKQHPHRYQEHPKAYQPQQEAGWMTPEIRRELHSRNQLRNASQLSGSPADRQAYHTQCQRVQALIDSAKANLGNRGSIGNVGSPGVLGSQQYQQRVAGQGYQQASMGGQMYQHPASERQQQQGEPEESFSCGPCNRTFYSRRQLDHHLKEHVECPFPECRLSAHPKVVERHIDNQHLLVNFANLQIDDEQWVAERKRRFPTSQRAELRRATQLERTKRGERLGRTTKPFPDKLGKMPRGGGGGRGRGRGAKEVRKTRDHKEQNGQKQDDSTGISGEPGRGAGRRGRRRGQPHSHNSRDWKTGRRSTGPTRPPPPTPDDLLDSDEEARDGIPAFRGTRHLYESTGEVSYFGSTKEGEEDSDAGEKDEINISDEEEWVAKDVDAPCTPTATTTTTTTTLSLGGALGCLMGAYSDSEEDSDAPDTSRKAPPPDNNESVDMTNRGEKPSTEEDGRASLNDNNTDGKTNSSSREEHTSANRETDAGNSSATRRETNSDGKTDAGSGEDAMPQNAGPYRYRKRHHRGAKKKRTTPNPRAASHPLRRIPKRRKTLLHRLLLPDITRERNLILQCVRFIVQNNFFMSGEEGETDTANRGGRQQAELERNNGEGGKDEREEVQKERKEEAVVEDSNEGEGGKEDDGEREKTTPEEQLNNGSSGHSTQGNAEDEAESHNTEGTPLKRLGTEARATTAATATTTTTATATATTTPVTTAKDTPEVSRTNSTCTDTPDGHGANMTDGVEVRTIGACGNGMDGAGANGVIAENGCPLPPSSGNRAVTAAKKRSLQALLEEGSDMDTAEEESASKRQNSSRQGDGVPP